jgi:hypothetical protein
VAPLTLPPEVDVPGMRPALLAVRALMSELAPGDPHVLPRAVVAVMSASRAHVQAEVLADVADYLQEEGLNEAADLLDQISYEMRKKAPYAG